MSLGRLTLALPIAAGLLAGTACTIDVGREGYIEREEKRFPADKLVELHLYTFDGSMEVRSWDRAEVLVEVEKRGRDKEAVSKIQVLAERTGDRIQVEARRPAGGNFVGFGVFTSPSTKFIVSVPLKTNLVVRTGDGSILVERVDGRLELRSGDGTIKAVETAGDLVAESGDGTIQVDDVTGRVAVRTDDGSLRVSGTPTALHARSGDGSVVLRIRRGASMSEDWVVTTGDGSISAELPSDFSAEIEADPGSDGRARCDLTLANASGGTRDQRVLRGRLGDGGHRLTLRTGDGTIRLSGL
jgi:Toastrack DUF4097